jgi:hypothetical protein
MAVEPIVIYSRKVDPAGVLALIRARHPGLALAGPPDDWRQITITRERPLRKPMTLTSAHDPEYYDGPDFADQMRGRQGYFSRFPGQPHLDAAMRSIDTST